MNKKDVLKLIPADLTQEYIEIGIGELVEEAKQFIPVLGDVASEVPWVKTFIAVIKFPRTCSDYLLGRKVYAFLYSSGLSQSKIKQFKEKFSKTDQEQLWQRVVFSINAHDDERKSEIVGKLFDALVDDFIDKDEFFALVHATNSLNVHTLERLKELYDLSFTSELSGSQYYSFATLGLIEADDTGNPSDGGGQRYPLNQLGWKYVGVAFGFPDSSIAGLKIGQGVLVSELNDSYQMTNKAYPVSYLQTKGLHYRKLNVFEVTQDDGALCDPESGLPLPVADEAIPSGCSPDAFARQLTIGYAEAPVGIATRNMEDLKIQRWSYFVKSGSPVAGGLYRSKTEIMEQFLNGPVDDETKYYIEVVRHLPTTQTEISNRIRVK